MKAIALALLFLTGCDALAEKQMDDINKQVVKDAVAQYEIAKRGSDPMATCVHAGMVSAAAMQAKDEAAYTKWKAVEKADCAKAGLVQP